MLYPHATYPAIARTANRLCFTEWIRSSNLWRLDTVSGERSRLVGSTGSSLFPQYSPDGRKIAYQSDEGGNQELYTCDADGSNRQRLTNIGGAVAGTPRWSPDGQWLAFDSRKDGQADIYVMPASGGSQRRVTHAPPFDNSMPAWSSDGHGIYFTSTRTGRPEIWKARAEGGQEEQVTRSGGEAAVVSRDGRYLYFVKGQGLFRMPAGGGDEQPVLSGYSSVYDHAVGMKGVYTLEAGTLRLLDTAARKTSTLLTLDRLPLTLCVSPDDRYVVWGQLDSNTSDLMLVEHFR
jgi:Tol biopolymer transport system component